MGPPKSSLKWSPIAMPRSSTNASLMTWSFDRPSKSRLTKAEMLINSRRRSLSVTTHEFLDGEKVEQEIAEGCRRLIKNAIFCWNYLYLSHRIGQEQTAERRQELLKAIQNGSVASWRHSNLQGEYDVADKKL